MAGQLIEPTVECLHTVTCVNVRGGRPCALLEHPRAMDMTTPDLVREFGKLRYGTETTTNAQHQRLIEVVNVLRLRNVLD